LGIASYILFHLTTYNIGGAYDKDNVLDLHSNAAVRARIVMVVSDACTASFHGLCTWSLGSEALKYQGSIGGMGKRIYFT